MPKSRTISCFSSQFCNFNNQRQNNGKHEYWIAKQTHVICLPSQNNITTTRTEMRKTVSFNYAIQNVTNDIENVVSKAQAANLKLAPTVVNCRCIVNDGLVAWKHNYWAIELVMFSRQNIYGQNIFSSKIAWIEGHAGAMGNWE